MIKIEIAKEGNEEAQIIELAQFMVRHNQLIFYPVIFLQGWISKKIKVFSHRDDTTGEIDGLHIVSLFTDPITSNTHFIVNFKAGVDISEYVNEALELYNGED